MKISKNVLLLVLTMVKLISSYHITSLLHNNNHNERCRLSAISCSSLLPDPTPNSIGNFFDNSTDNVSFIQCYMLSIGITFLFNY